MADPVVFDDGGSTRIRQLNSFTMDGLLGIVGGGGGVTFQDAAAASFVNGGGVFSCTLRVRHHDPDGFHHIQPGGPGLPLQRTDTVTITSQNGQVATLTFDAATFRMVITLSAGGGVTPIVEARQNNNQRRYIVTNAGPIQSVVVTRAGVPTQVFPPAGAQPSIYTMVHFM
ncbi:MAG TPA: hypothetical protein VKE70_37645 [Candidatus Solibacter sp.]|nr:hypothetical protein [Candidatus Solibacter sp.]